MFERIISSDPKGFTLIEVLLSITIFSILTIGMLQFFHQAMDFSNRNEDETMGINVARNMMDYMKQQDFYLIDQYYLPNETKSAEIRADSCKDTLSTGKKVFNQTEEIRVDGQITNRCELEFSPTINNRKFNVTVNVRRLKPEDLKNSGLPVANLTNLNGSLIPVEVVVTWGKQQNANLEGYIASEKNR